jgi:hypothetical protein
MAKPKDSKREEEIRDRLGSSAPDLTEQEIEAAENDREVNVRAGQSFDPSGSGNYKETKKNWGQSDKSGWGNQGNHGNEGYYQGFESTNEDRSRGDQPEPDLSERANQTTKQRDKD